MLVQKAWICVSSECHIFRAVIPDETAKNTWVHQKDGPHRWVPQAAEIQWAAGSIMEGSSLGFQSKRVCEQPRCRYSKTLLIVFHRIFSDTGFRITRTSRSVLKKQTTSQQEMSSRTLGGGFWQGAVAFQQHITARITWSAQYFPYLEARSALAE